MKFMVLQLQLGRAPEDRSPKGMVVQIHQEPCNLLNLKMKRAVHEWILFSLSFIYLVSSQKSII